MKYYCKKCRLIAGADEPACDCGKDRTQIDDGMAELYLKRGYILTPKEAQRRDAEVARAAEEEARRQEAARAAEEEARRQEAARAAEEARQREAARAAEEARQREAARAAEEARQREVARAAEEEARRQEAARAAEEEARQREAARIAAEEERRRQREMPPIYPPSQDGEEPQRGISPVPTHGDERLPFEFGTDEPLRDEKKIKNRKNNRISLPENIPWKGVGITVLILSVILLIYIFRYEIMNLFVMLMQTVINILVTGAIVLIIIAAFIGWIRRAFRRW